MEIFWRNALWHQFGAAIDMLDNALLACPDALWGEALWPLPDDPLQPDPSSAFWHIVYHTLAWLDSYLSRTAEGFTPPEPFTRHKLVPPGAPYTRDELHTYLVQTREKCHSIITTLSDEDAARPFSFAWAKEKPISFYELLIYTMRHVQEHAAQLSLFLGQHGGDGQLVDWVEWAKEAPRNA